MGARVRLEPWSSGDLPLLERLMGDPRMPEHLGGPESPASLRERQRRYEEIDGGDRMFRIVDAATGAGVGSVGFWTRDWRDERVHEIGWMVVVEWQGRGIAAAATAQAIDVARRARGHRWMHAFPNADNAPSNAICRKLGFALLGPCEVEFPKGHAMTCNDWRLDLRALARCAEHDRVVAAGRIRPRPAPYGRPRGGPRRVPRRPARG
jgi:RimJ/RimL family protein N-acetyltransferase